jgi:hypothetical protein
MKNTKNTVAAAPTPVQRIENHKGRFVSVSARNSRGRVNKFCGKVVSITPSYVTFNDVNSGETVKLAKTSLV